MCQMCQRKSKDIDKYLKIKGDKKGAGNDISQGQNSEIGSKDFLRVLRGLRIFREKNTF